MRAGALTGSESRTDSKHDRRPARFNDRVAGRLTALGAVALLLGGCGAAALESEGPHTDPLESVSAEELYRRGRLLTEGGDHIRAEQYIAAAIQRGYDEERAMPALLQACLGASRLVAALQYAEPYLLRHPEHWPLRMLVASIHMGLEHPGQARDELERVLEDAPEEPPQAHYFLGVIYRDQLVDAARAEEHFQRYLVLSPDGEHREEAAAGIPHPINRPLPQRVPTPDAGADDDADADAGEGEGADDEAEQAQ